jgi:hypothetical protein
MHTCILFTAYLSFSVVFLLLYYFPKIVVLFYYLLHHNCNNNYNKCRPLFQRVLELTNYHAGYDLKAPGQEEFTIIQYNKEDQYT